MFMAATAATPSTPLSVMRPTYGATYSAPAATLDKICMAHHELPHVIRRPGRGGCFSVDASVRCAEGRGMGPNLVRGVAGCGADAHSKTGEDGSCLHAGSGEWHLDYNPLVESSKLTSTFDQITHALAPCLTHELARAERKGCLRELTQCRDRALNLPNENVRVRRV